MSVVTTDNSVNTTVRLVTPPRYVITSTSNDVVIYCEIVFSFLLTPLLCLLGVVGNVLNVIILRHHGLRDKVNILLLSISVCDLFFSLSQLVIQVNRFIRFATPAMALTLTSFVNLYVLPVNQTCFSISICHVTTIAIERLVAVCFPFHVSRIFTQFRLKICVVFLFVYPIVMTTPTFLNYEIRWVRNPTYNITVATLSESSLNLNTYESFNIFNLYVVGNLLSTVPPTMILGSSIVIALTIAVKRKEFSGSIGAANLATKSLKEKKMFKMLLTICLLSLVVCFPTSVLDMYNSYGMTSSALVRTYQILRSLLSQINASANFIIYVTMSTKFAKTYRSLMSGLQCRELSHAGI
ncbi:probable G-protein coupled receptor 21 [Physella acuta]|uniref:probable G-protein coupled receptor 21 n=1 Tax=Physella acuta TaxID=109671 RepID=UPI0027DE9FA0|nr:probable G-protein coupled receptor 21 [Physella acuta]